MRINDVIVYNKNEGEDIIAALYLSTRLLRNISAGRGGTHLHSRQEECGEFEANWTITYILFKPCIHSVMFTWTTKLPNLFFFSKYTSLHDAQNHTRIKRLPWTEGWGVTHQEESGGFPVRCCVDSTMSITEPLASALPVHSGWWGRIGHVFFGQL